MELKPGYKQSDAGVIPEDWSALPLGECLIDHPSYGINAAAVPYSDALPAYIRITDISEDGRFSPDKLVSVKSEQADNYYLSDGDIVFARTGASVGKSYRYNPQDGALVFAGFLIRVRPDANMLLPAFAAAYLTTGNYWRWVRLMSMRSGQPGINGNEYSRLPIPLPPLPEQGAIAKVLSNVDELLATLEKMIAKKRDLKQAALQQLLTGNTRLPGFGGEWSEKKLGDLITHCASGATPRRNRPEFFHGDIKWITSGELNYNTITDTIEKISDEAVAETNLNVHPVGTFLMAITGLEAEGTRGACGIVGSPATTNQSCMAIFPTSELATEYLFHYYVFKGKSLALQYCQGTKQQSYTAGLVKQLPIKLPPTRDEQIAIASTLSDMDSELLGLEAQSKKTRNIKQAMMQELLTGKTRLIAKEECHV